jgi:hypothetical protein
MTLIGEPAEHLREGERPGKLPRLRLIRPWFMVGKCLDQQPRIKTEGHHLRQPHMQTACGVHMEQNELKL